MIQEQYRKFVEDLAKNKTNKEFLNADTSHALIVFGNLFKYAEEEICIFASCLCGDSEDYLANQNEYLQELSSFIERGGKLSILLNNYVAEKAASSRLMKRIAYYQTESQYKDNIQLKETASRFHLSKETDKEIHFTVADEKAYRIELDIEKKIASCNFNNPSTATNIKRVFTTTFESAIPINLSAFFSN
jgi:hypothetical protein